MFRNAPLRPARTVRLGVNGISDFNGLHLRKNNLGPASGAAARSLRLGTADVVLNS
jgi:hypothetical protein